MKYVLIDDGYQNKMGDWLTVKKDFGCMSAVCDNIRSAGALPAIWIAPFIAERDSNIMRNHPEYFIRDESGNPLSSDEVSFCGWRCAPWYMLDGTNPAAMEYIKCIY